MHETDALSSDFRFYSMPVNENNTDVIYTKYNKFYIAQSGKNRNDNGLKFYFVPNPMGTEKFAYPEEWNTKIQVLAEAIK